MSLVRLQKYLADQGVASRRTCEKYILDGLVSVNGSVVCEMGVKVDPEKDHIEYDSRAITKAQEAAVTAVFYKPRGYETTMTGDGEDRTVGAITAGLSDSVGVRLLPAGRLDKESEGMLVLTSDGDLLYRLTHPSFGHEKEYEVMVSGIVNDAALSRLSSGVVIDGRKTTPCKVTRIRSGAKDGRVALRFILKEGRNRQIRKMCEVVHLSVHRLTRLRVGNLTIKGVKPYGYRILTSAEIKKLLA